ncbi:Hypothetical_protein [Hexamita inflata]|uniref:Hypothetical_protein n=1 Tax=Hexamita inflata TaxID=28002 RepID=A0AA86QCU1_9EUKA|nr:Hypothetical protein HINF_LOCUS41532 [Hexamita inflata]
MFRNCGKCRKNDAPDLDIVEIPAQATTTSTTQVTTNLQTTTEILTDADLNTQDITKSNSVKQQPQQIKRQLSKGSPFSKQDNQNSSQQLIPTESNCPASVVKLSNQQLRPTPKTKQRLNAALNASMSESPVPLPEPLMYNLDSEADHNNESFIQIPQPKLSDIPKTNLELSDPELGIMKMDEVKPKSSDAANVDTEVITQIKPKMSLQFDENEEAEEVEEKGEFDIYKSKQNRQSRLPVFDDYFEFEFGDLDILSTQPLKSYSPPQQQTKLTKTQPIKQASSKSESSRPSPKPAKPTLNAPQQGSLTNQNSLQNAAITNHLHNSMQMLPNAYGSLVSTLSAQEKAQVDTEAVRQKIQKMIEPLQKQSTSKKLTSVELIQRKKLTQKPVTPKIITPNLRPKSSGYGQNLTPAQKNASYKNDSVISARAKTPIMHIDLTQMNRLRNKSQAENGVIEKAKSVKKVVVSLEPGNVCSLINNE